MSLVDHPETETLPKLLARNARNYPRQPGMREKDRGIWKTMSWQECHQFMRDFALGLTTLGLTRAGKMSVVGDNNPRLYLAMMSAQAIGAIAVPVYQDAMAPELSYILDHAEVSIIVAEDQEQVDKILSLRDRLPRLTAIIYDDPRGMLGYHDPILRRLGSIVEAGQALAQDQPGLFDGELAKGRAGDVAMLCYTSGTTGRPKGALLSHANMIGTAENYAKVEDVRRGDEWLSYLPMAWVGDAMYSMAAALVCVVTISTPESPETVQRDLRELAPTGLLAPPRIWESLLTQVQIKAADASPMKRRVYEAFRRLAEECELLRSDGKAVPASKRLGLMLGEIFVYGPVRDQLGFRRSRWAMTGGAPLGPDTFRFFRSFGVNLKQVYGATEASALVAIHRDGDVDPNTVGKPVPGLEVKIAEDGELLLRGPGIFIGYFKQDEATSATKTADGWLHTGDAAIIDPRGHMAIIDRAKDVGRLSDGSTFAPQFVENKLKFSPFIREAVAFGSDRAFVAAMIVIDLGTVGSWAERSGLVYTSFMDLARKPEVAALVLHEVGKVNATLPESIRVKRILLLNKELEADDNEVTRTRKVRRGHVALKYAPVVQAFYGGAPAVDVTVEITFEDGRRSTMTTNIPIHDVAATASLQPLQAAPRRTGGGAMRAEAPTAHSQIP